MNGDGLSDFIVGAESHSHGETAEGGAFLYLGSPTGPSLAPFWMAESDQDWAYFGASVAGVGDCNGDGIFDVLVGAPFFDGDTTNEGRVFLYSIQAIPDCNANGVPDSEDILSGTSLECNGNTIPDECDVASGISGDSDGDGVPDECESPALAFCFGDGSGSFCPCSNPGDAGRGCASGSAHGGARLLALGSASITAGDLVLHAFASVAKQPGLFYQGDNALNGGSGVAFGDGLRCAGGGLVRLQVVHATPVGTAATTRDISGAGGVSAGEVKRYQWWYRDPRLSRCGARFNLSNGIEIAWQP